MESMYIKNTFNTLTSVIYSDTLLAEKENDEYSISKTFGPDLNGADLNTFHFS
jgi:hypothetical protein